MTIFLGYVEVGSHLRSPDVLVGVGFLFRYLLAMILRNPIDVCSI